MYCQITREPIDARQLTRRVRSDADGAVVLFMGTVRDHHQGRSVADLEYEAYEEMALEVLEQICEEARKKFAIGDIAVIHRIGSLAIGDVSVAIAVAAPHRDAAYGASREIIERLKREVPIWKRERYADGTVEWQEGGG